MTGMQQPGMQGMDQEQAMSLAKNKTPAQKVSRQDLLKAVSRLQLPPAHPYGNLPQVWGSNG